MRKLTILLLPVFFLLAFFVLMPRTAQATVTNINILSPTNANPVSVNTNSTTTITYTVTLDQYLGYQCYVRLFDKKSVEQYNQVCDIGAFPVGTFEYSTVLNIGAWTEDLYTVVVAIVGGANDSELSSLGIDDTAPSVPTVLYPSAAGIYIPAGSFSTTSISWATSTDNVIFKDKPISIEYSLLGNFSDALLIGGYDATPANITWVTPNVTSTTTRIRITSTDLAGNFSSDISNFTFTLDNLAPTVDAGSYVGVISSPAAPGASASDNISSPENLTYSWMQVTAPSGGSLVVSNNSVLNPELSGQVSGDYVAQLEVTDQAGKVATDTVNFTWYGDPERPTVLTPSAPGISLQGGTYNITWTPPTDTDLLANPISIYYSATGDFGDSVLVVAYTANDGSYTWTVPNDNTERALIRVVAEDIDGNTNFDESDNLFVIGDPYPPVVSVTPVSSPTNNTSPTVTGSVVDASNDVTSIESKIDAGTWGACTIIGSGLSVTFSCATSTLSEGNHTVYVRATDSIGNVSSSSANFTSFIVDTTNPSTDLFTPDAAGILLRGGEIYDITWHVTDANISGNSILLEYSLNNGSSWTTITNTVNDDTYLWTVPGANSSLVLVRITATDDAGNSASDVSTNTFIIDSTPPAITVTSPNLGAINSATAAGVSATDANGVASYAWTKISGSGTVTFSPNATSTNPTFSASTDDSYTVRVTVTDNAGNTSTSDVLFIWDTTNPSTSLLTPDSA
ncbi:Ig-like domain repeat protein, partial [Patescibacteria group bacterium]|nr:Ig-like domain repeat protein [Patescibacteria group bacterium]